jgi:transcription-repair coupling factor (superfamily II helicase)
VVADHRPRRPVTIPEDYVEDLTVRLGLYRRLSTLENDAEMESFGAELIDRFGPLPPEVEQLLKIVTIKILCREANVEKVEAGPKGVVVHFREKSFANPQGLAAMVVEQGSFAKVRPDMSVVFIPRARQHPEAPEGDHADHARARHHRQAGEEGGVTGRGNRVQPATSPERGRVSAGHRT